MAVSYPQIERAVSELFYDYTEVAGSLPEIDIIPVGDLGLVDKVAPFGVVQAVLRSKVRTRGEGRGWVTIGSCAGA